ncbi:hypothetical protein KSS87_017776, partial [Heliosperma pusillum]
TIPIHLFYFLLKSLHYSSIILHHHSTCQKEKSNLIKNFKHYIRVISLFIFLYLQLYSTNTNDWSSPLQPFSTKKF